MLRELAQGAQGLAEIVYHAPGQAVRTFSMLPPDDRGAIIKAVKAKIPLGEGYFYDGPVQVGAFKEDKLTKALPAIVIGIVLFVGYNIFIRRS